MHLTEKAISKINEMIQTMNPSALGIRMAIVGGGCSGYSYDLDFEETKQTTDFVLDFDDLKVFVDPMSFQYLDGTKVDYVESFQYSGFDFDNPNATKKCGCGSSFAV
jgi:iron-sulfur cluster assembly accessory protein